MDLCGHATLAAAHVLFEALGYEGDQILFATQSGELMVRKKGDFLEMNFPARVPEPAILPDVIRHSLNIPPLEVWKSRDYLLLYAKEEDILAIKPDIALMNQINIDPGGVIVTARGNEVDFVSRFFTPQAVIFEDPVTGSAHCSLVPFWADRLNKTELHARQISRRGGELFCNMQGDRVYMRGKAITYLQGTISI
jgi:PhzF family phenazine biosynthesis protein